MAEPETAANQEVAQPKRVFDMDDIDLAMIGITALATVAMGIIGWKLTGTNAGTAIAGIFGTAATGLGSLARGRKKATAEPTE
jgi:hypothetical protein